MKWELLPEYRDEYIRKLSKAGKGGGRRESLQLGSPSNSPRNQKVVAPSSDDNESGAVLRFTAADSQRSVTPPPSSNYRVQPLEAYTPDRGSRVPALRAADKMLSSETPAKPMLGSGRPQIRQGGLLSVPASDGVEPASPVPGNQTSLYDAPDATATALTPAPQRQHPRLAPPSASQLPSSYLPTSSPAPFWKYVSFGSTPAKPTDYSPLKLDLHSSSPPPMAPRLEEGTITTTNRRIRELGSPLKERSPGFLLTTPGKSTNLPEPKDLEDDDDGLGDFPGIDLTRFVTLIVCTGVLFFFFSFDANGFGDTGDSRRLGNSI